jgi:hypothetical protein
MDPMAATVHVRRAGPGKAGGPEHDIAAFISDRNDYIDLMPLPVN